MSSIFVAEPHDLNCSEPTYRLQRTHKPMEFPNVKDQGIFYSLCGRPGNRAYQKPVLIVYFSGVQ